MGYMLVDGNSIGYAAHFSPTLTCDGQEVQAVFQFLNIMRRMRREWPGMTPIVLWDGKPVYRLEMYPEYKAQRDDTEEKRAYREGYASQRPIIQKLLSPLGINQVMPVNYEADDLAYYFTSKALDLGKTVVLISGDRDWLQLITEGVVWHDPRDKSGKTCRHDTFEDFTGFRDPQSYMYGKAFLGDPSDNIPGIKGIGEKCSRAILSAFSSPGALKAAAPFEKEDLPQELRRFRKVLNRFSTSDEEWKEFERNVQLMMFRMPPDEDVKVRRARKDMDIFYDECHELQFLSITRLIDEWDIF